MKRITDTNIILSTLTILTICSGAILSSTITSADDVVDTISVSVPMSCTISGSGQTSHDASIVDGLYEDDIGTTTLKVYCNDSAGFAVYATGYTGNEIGAADSNKLIGTTNTDLKIITGTATGPVGGDDISNWAMKLSTNVNATYPITLDNGFGSYSAVPNSYTKVAHRDSSTDLGASATGAELTTTYAAYISKTQPADTYSGQVIYTLVHPSTADAPFVPHAIECEAGKICYNTNTAPTETEGTMGKQGATDGSTKTLLASNFSRPGYGFAGWSDKYDYATNQTANLYGPQEDITVPEGTTANGLSLYAIWIKSEGSIQDTAKVAETCNRLTQSGPNITKTLASVSALTDQRDNQTYAIAKLADGNCWMIENLRLDNTAAHNSDGSLAQGYGTTSVYGNFGGLADAESSNFVNSATANSLYYSGTQSGTASININTSNHPEYRMPRYNNSNTSSRASNPTSNSAAIYSYGNYYTWSAAIANTANYTGGDHDSTSICPSGWKLPLSYSNTEGKSYSALSPSLGGPENGNTANSSSTPTGTVTSKIFRSFPNNFLYPGQFTYSSTYNRGVYGYYWTSSAYTDDRSYGLGLNSSTVYPGTYVSHKYEGQSIRCVVGL